MIERVEEVSLPVSWNTIIYEFYIRYDSVYDNSSSKVHLDLNNQIIDGAKDKWKDVSLLDCILCFVLGNDKVQRECSRRRFNQYQAFRESVCTACSESWVNMTKQSLSSSTNPNTSIATEFPRSIRLEDVVYPWNSINVLRDSFLRNAPKKSIRKRYRIVEEYFSLSIFHDKTLYDVISAAISIVYIQHYHPVNHTLTRVKILETKDKQILSESQSEKLVETVDDMLTYAQESILPNFNT